MVELALPNLHPAVIHFPLVLAPLALLVEIATSYRRTMEWDRIAAALWTMAAVAATVAYIAGRFAADGLVDVDPRTQPAIGDHADWAQYSLILLWVVAVLRGAALVLRENRAVALGLSALVVVVGVAVQGVLFLTADKGGALVYQHGVAVTMPARTRQHDHEVGVPSRGELEPIARSAGTLTLLEAEGTLTWTPGPGEAALLGASEAEPPPEQGVAVAVHGEQTMLLPPELDDVQLNVWLDLSGFEGEAFLLHHHDGTTGGALVVSPTRGTRLIDLANAHSALDSAAGPVPARAVFSVSAAGSHLKGMVNGKMVVHGHTAAAPAGQIGLRFEGEGVAVIERLEAIRLEAH
jgi:uncharacterized membrane protein